MTSKWTACRWFSLQVTGKCMLLPGLPNFASGDCSGVCSGLLWLEALSFYCDARGRIGSRDLKAFIFPLKKLPSTQCAPLKHKNNTVPWNALLVINCLGAQDSQMGAQHPSFIYRETIQTSLDESNQSWPWKQLVYFRNKQFRKTSDSRFEASL